MHRTVMFTALALSTMAGFAYSEEPQPPVEFQSAVARVGPQSAVIPASGTWEMETDSKLNGELEAGEGRLLVLTFTNGQFVGHYKDHRADGSENNSVFTGQVIAGESPVVTLRQDDRPHYTAIYAGRLVSEGRIVGSYVDNRGFNGDWSLTLIGKPIIEPLAKGIPDELLFESVLGVYGKAIRGKRHPYVNLRPPHRNLWTDEIKETVQRTLSYGDVDYIGTAKMVIPDSGMYAVDIPGAGVQFRVNGQLLEAGEIELKKGLYEIEIYTNHWGQPYLTFAQATVYKKDTEIRIPFVNTASDIEAFRSQKIAGDPVIEVCEYVPERVDPERH